MNELTKWKSTNFTQRIDEALRVKTPAPPISAVPKVINRSWLVRQRCSRYQEKRPVLRAAEWALAGAAAAWLIGWRHKRADVVEQHGGAGGTGHG